MMYDLVQGISYISALVFVMLYGKHYGVSKFKSVIMMICGMICYLFLLKFLAWAENGFRSFGAENAIRAYVFLPLLIYGLAKLGGIETFVAYDLIGLGCLLGYGVGHYACIFAGCCHGFAYHDGTIMYKIAYTLTKTNMLPLQFMEATSAMLIFGLLCYVAAKMNYQTNGRVLCLWYLLFGTTRFLWEFLRDNEKVIKFAPLKQADGYFGISSLAIWSALMVGAGFVVYSNIRKWEMANASATH